MELLINGDLGKSKITRFLPSLILKWLSSIFYNLVFTEPDRIVSALFETNYGGYRTEEFVGSQITYCLKSLI
jgi:hypothetical protein